MSKQHRWFIYSFFLLILGLGWIWITRAPQGFTTTALNASPYPGFQAPFFTLKSTNQDSVDLASLKGKPILVNFWASWCIPCRTEMPAIQEVYNDYASDGLEVLAINATNQDSLPEVLSFIDQYQLSIPVLLDETGEISNTYRVQSLPTTFFINQDGIINEVVIGGMSEALLRIKIEQLLQGLQKEID